MWYLPLMKEEEEEAAEEEKEEEEEEKEEKKEEEEDKEEKEEEKDDITFSPLTRKANLGVCVRYLVLSRNDGDILRSVVVVVVVVNILFVINITVN